MTGMCSVLFYDFASLDSCLKLVCSRFSPNGCVDC